jgi:dihydroorotate dehydrogenase (NAD+) catalytic subunit
VSASGPGCDLSVQLGPVRLPSPILVASGTFGYAREMEHLVDLSRLGAVIPKTITSQPRAGNRPWRTVETTAGLLNSIGLDNDGLEGFIAHHLPYLSKLPCPTIVSIAGSSHDDFCAMAQRLGQESGIAALELNISCPNVAHGVDFGVNAEICRRLISGIRAVCPLPLSAKLTPNVTSIPDSSKAAEEGGSNPQKLINT